MKKIILGVGCITLALLAGGYIGARSVVESEARKTVEVLQRNTPEHLRLDLGNVSVGTFLRKVEFRGVALSSRAGTLTMRRVTAAGLLANVTNPDERSLSKIVAHKLHWRDGEGVDLRAKRLVLRRVTMAGPALQHAHAAEGLAQGLTFRTPEQSGSSRSIQFESLSPKRIGRIYLHRATLLEGFPRKRMTVSGLGIRNVAVDRVYGSAMAAFGKTLSMTRPGPRDAGRLFKLTTGQIAVSEGAGDGGAIDRLSVTMSRRNTGDLAAKVLLDGIVLKPSGTATGSLWSSWQGKRLPALGIAANVRFDPYEDRLDVERLLLDVPGRTRIHASGSIDGAQHALTSGSAGGALQGLRLAALKLDIDGDGLFQEWIAQAAGKAGVSRKTMLADQIGDLSRMARNAPRPVRRSANALGRFLRQGGHLSLEVTPSRPVPLNRLRAVADESPEHLIVATEARLRLN